MKLETTAIHAGKHIDPETGAVTVPIHMSTTFLRDEDGGYSKGFSYGRGNNPTRATLESRLAALEGGAAALAFSSGTAAISAILQTLAPGDHIIAPRDIYYGVIRTLREIFIPWGIQVSYVDMTSEDELKAALRPNTKLVWVETPSNPRMHITPIGRTAEIAHAAGAICVCDNTFATPVLQNPLRHGADAVMHSTTKFINGHTDVIGGAVITRENGPLYQKIKLVQTNVGAIPSPFDCWLILRGIATLPLRMKAHSENAMKVVSYLAAHPKVEAVYYAGLPTHPGHDIAAEQMSDFGGMASFQYKGSREDTLRIVAKARLFTRATSLGGVESLIEHRISVEGPGSTTPDNLVRLSIGLENAEDLIDDLKQALA